MASVPDDLLNDIERRLPKATREKIIAIRKEKDPNEGWCFAREDETHCDHWWNCEPCCSCGFDGGGSEDCDCPRHTAERA